MPIEHVMHSPPTATPSCAQPGGRYRDRRARGRIPARRRSCADLQRRARVERCVEPARDSPATQTGGLQQEHVVAVDVWADAAAVAGPRNHQVVEPRVGHEPKLLNSAWAASWCKSTPCTSNVHPPCATAESSSARSVPASATNRCAPCRERVATPRHRALPMRTSPFGTSAARSAGIAPRTSKGLRCQWRRMNSRGVRPAEQRSARSARQSVCGAQSRYSLNRCVAQDTNA